MRLVDAVPESTHRARVRLSTKRELLAAKGEERNLDRAKAIYFTGSPDGAMTYQMDLKP